MTKYSDKTEFDKFAAEMHQLIDGVAEAKGYDRIGDFVAANFGEGHSLGEIVYKAVRYNRKHDKADLIKIASWAYILWRRDEDRKA